MEPMNQKLEKSPGSHYDSVMFEPAGERFYENSGFWNFGYWDNANSPREASWRLMEKLIEFLPGTQGRLLDVACGQGATTLFFAEHFSPENITGINISQKQLDSAIERVPEATFLLMDAVELDFPDSSFDVVSCVEAAFHFDTRERFLREAHRVLKPGGWIVLSDLLMTRTAERDREFRVEANYLSGRDDYARLMERCGFPDATVQDATHSCWDPFFLYGIQSVHKKLLAREIDLDGLHQRVKGYYQRAADIEHYILAAGCKS
jgi:MPBQ/MSBQ methyltransferase